MEETALTTGNFPLTLTLSHEGRGGLFNGSAYRSVFTPGFKEEDGLSWGAAAGGEDDGGAGVVAGLSIFIRETGALFQFTLSERPSSLTLEEAFKRLMSVGGFPEPFLDGDEREARRWRKERFDRILKDDVRDLEAVRDITTLSLFADALRRRVGGLVVLDNIAQELQVTHKTLKQWLETLERMYMVFVVRPFTQNIPRAILKPPKVYFFDNADVIGDDGARFENLVATTLLKRLHFLEDRDGYRYDLCYIRDKEKREVDFAIVKDGQVEELIEVKYSDTSFSRSLSYYAEHLKPKKAIQIVATARRSMSKGNLVMEGPFESLSVPLSQL